MRQVKKIKIHQPGGEVDFFMGEKISLTLYQPMLQIWDVLKKSEGGDQKINIYFLNANSMRIMVICNIYCPH